jgi:hypothetical protein
MATETSHESPAAAKNKTATSTSSSIELGKVMMFAVEVAVLLSRSQGGST